MELRLYDTLTREKRVFTPIDPARVRMYVCGPTVYDFAHIGNARPVIVFDVLFRLLRHIYGVDHVTYVRNVTDVDDKINARAAEHGISIGELTKKTYEDFKADVAALGCLEPTFEPRATEYVSKPDAPTDMIRLIEKLVQNGCAYSAEGHVLFNVSAMKGYGKLSNRSLDEMIAGARVEVAPYKKDPMDFVLWKPSPPELPGWDSPWGRGRPGWHIECSAMAAALLGETFDIHGGGIDLVFPHHENEIAQSRCAFHTKVMANYWMHNGFLQVEGEKMSKSLGNFVTIRELLSNWKGRAWSGNSIKLAMLGNHYRQPINWSVERIAEAERELLHVSGEILQISQTVFKNDTKSFSDWLGNIQEPVPSEFAGALLDDLNTPAALSAVRTLYGSASENRLAAEQILACFELLGLFDRKTIFLSGPAVLRGFRDREVLDGMLLAARKYQIGLMNRNENIVQEMESLFSEGEVDVLYGPGRLLILSKDPGVVRQQKAEIERLIKERDVARKTRNFAESDRIRDELAKMGVVLKDSKDGTTWEIAR
ncbi:MAG TPA: cysteine--tRNA ligase [Pseudolabrys sp.]